MSGSIVVSSYGLSEEFFHLYVQLTWVAPSPFVDTIGVGDNSLGGSVPDEICALRSDALNNFIVDCPGSGGDGGIVCGVPECCTGCF